MTTLENSTLRLPARIDRQTEPPGMGKWIALLALAYAARKLAPERLPAHLRTRQADGSRTGRDIHERQDRGTEADGSDAGRGREADSPTEIPARGWKDILWRTYEQINDDRVLAVAAGVVFYGLLALFPAVTALVSLYALVADGHTINQHLAEMSGFLPQGAFSIVQDQVSRVLAKGNTKLGLAFAFSFGLALWSANGGMKAIIDALNVVYDEKETRSFIRLNLLSLTFTIAGIIVILAAIGLVVAVPIVFTALGFDSIGSKVVQFGRWPLLAVLLVLGLAVLYRFAPNRREPQWKWITPGSIFATVSWLIGSALLSFYLSNYGHYDATYGSLGAAIGLMIWMWMSTIVVMVGAELNSEIEHQTTVDSTEGGHKPMGARGAKMADTVGGAR